MKAAIVGLVRGHNSIQGYQRLILRNRMLHKNFNSQFGYPVLIFHEGNIQPNHQSVIAKITPNITFIDISDSAFILPDDIPEAWKTGLGYKHMCRFNAMQIYDILSDFNYIWRLDDDSIIGQKVNYDVFDFMHENNYVYGFIHGENEYHRETCETLPPFTRDYILNNDIKINCNLSDINAYYFYSNFTITSVKFWHNPEVQDFLQAIDDSHGIYQYRWGDHVIQTLALKMFTDPDNIHHFQDISYAHLSHKWTNFQEKKNLANLYHRFQNRFYRYYSEFLTWQMNRGYE